MVKVKPTHDFGRSGAWDIQQNQRKYMKGMEGVPQQYYYDDRSEEVT